MKCNNDDLVTCLQEGQPIHKPLSYGKTMCSGIPYPPLRYREVVSPPLNRIP